MNWISHPTILKGLFIELIPLEKEHLNDLYSAANDKQIWEFYPGDWSVKEKFYSIYNKLILKRQNGEVYPFIIYHKAENKIIGSTRLMELAPWDHRLEIGGSWLQRKYWATPINLDCKISLLTFCFETLNVNRVQLKTQDNNLRSRKAIEKIGGKYEGLIRQHILKDDGTYRSSAYYSILKEEWNELYPNLKSLFEQQIAIMNTIKP